MDKLKSAINREIAELTAEKKEFNALFHIVKSLQDEVKSLMQENRELRNKIEILSQPKIITIHGRN